MFRLIVNVITRVRWFLRCYAPSNIALDAIRARRGHKWGIPAVLALVPAYLYAASFTTTLIERGGPGWLNLIVLTLIWDALKFAVMAPVSIGLLARARGLPSDRRAATSSSASLHLRGGAPRQTMRALVPTRLDSRWQSRLGFAVAIPNRDSVGTTRDGVCEMGRVK